MSPAVLEPPTIQKPRVDGPGATGFSAQVVVLNDDHTTFEHAIATLCKVIPGMNTEKAERFASEIHTQGRATVWSGNREAAELYVEQISDAGLRAELN